MQFIFTMRIPLSLLAPASARAHDDAHLQGFFRLLQLQLSHVLLGEPQLRSLRSWLARQNRQAGPY